MAMRFFVLSLLLFFLTLVFSFAFRQWEPLWWLFLASLPMYPLAALSYFITFVSKNSPMKFWAGRTTIDYCSSDHPLTRVFFWLRARFARDGFLVVPSVRRRMVRTLLRLDPIAFFLDRRAWERSFYWQALFYFLTAFLAFPAYFFYLLVFLFLIFDPLIFAVASSTDAIYLYRNWYGFFSYYDSIFFRLQEFFDTWGIVVREQGSFYMGRGKREFLTLVFSYRFPQSFFPFSLHHLMALTVPPALYFHYRLMVSIVQRYWEVFGPGPFVLGAIDRMDVWRRNTLRLQSLEGTILGLWINLFFVAVFYGYWFLFPLLRTVF